MSFPIDKIRSEFPILNREDRGLPMIYLDSGATTQKPQKVIDAINWYYKESNANVHRGIYPVGEESSRLYENVRTTVANFLNARSEKEVIFTRGATEAINLLAHSFVAPRLSEGDEILISHMEHHANIVPWQILCENHGAVLKVIPVTLDGELDLTDIDTLLNEKTKILSVTHVSNVLGTINPVKELIAKAHEKDIPVMLDGSQAVARIPVDLQDLDADFYVFSGHKLYAPTGIGALIGKEKYLNEMRPYQTGGDMILRVTIEKTTWNEIPHKFEAGTPNIAGAVGLAVAMNYLEEIGMENIQKYEEELLEYALERLSKVKGFRRVGNPKNSTAVISFILGDAHPHDVAHELGLLNICCRAGHHCAQPLMQFYKIPSTTRATFAIHTTREEIDKLATALAPIERKFRL